MTKKLDELANLWEKTKDPIYKDLWYKFIKEFGDGRAGTLDDDIRNELRRINNENSDGVQSSSDST
tara:strand:+ start:353 stop:550 length:198 start_codon:yes stop_codon:yes gene_type:complete